MTEQNYKNHTRLVPLYHYVAFLLLALVLGGSVVNLLHAAPVVHYASALLVVLSILTGIILWYVRAFALKAQDRAIRAEENLRHFAFTGKLLDNRLHMAQIIALRFAADEEFAALAKKAAEENLDAKTIKMAIRNWKPDHNRV